MRIFSTGLESGTQASTSENWEPAGGGLGLLNDIADAGWRIKNERLQNKWREDDRKEEAQLLQKVHELREERLGGSRSYLR